MTSTRVGNLPMSVRFTIILLLRRKSAKTRCCDTFSIGFKFYIWFSGFSFIIFQVKRFIFAWFLVVNK